MKSGGRVIMIGSAVGERVAAPGLAIRGHEGTSEMFTQALPERSGAGHHGQQRAACPIDTELNPAAGTGVPQKAAQRLSYGAWDEVAAMVAFVAARVPRTLPGEPYRGWRNERLRGV